jgi:hypothetical protein
MTKAEANKLREDLTPEQREKADKIGSSSSQPAPRGSGRGPVGSPQGLTGPCGLSIDSGRTAGLIHQRRGLTTNV